MSDRVHVIPLGDTHLHYAQSLCWCFPAARDGVMVHNAKDAREGRERQNNEKVSPGWTLVREPVED